MKAKLTCPTCGRISKFTISINAKMYCAFCVCEVVEQTMDANKKLIAEIIQLKQTLLMQSLKGDDLLIQQFKQEHKQLMSGVRTKKKITKLLKRRKTVYR